MAGKETGGAVNGGDINSGCWDILEIRAQPLILLEWRALAKGTDGPTRLRNAVLQRYHSRLRRQPKPSMAYSHFAGWVLPFVEFPIK